MKNFISDEKLGQVILESQGYGARQKERDIRLGGFIILAIIVVAIAVLLAGCDVAFAYTDAQIANAIFKAENSVKYPYGIKSIDTYGDPVYARKICLNTIRNNRKRFAKQTQYKDFIEFLGSRYCPVSAHPLNSNWVRNVNYFLGA